MNITPLQRADLKRFAKGDTVLRVDHHHHYVSTSYIWRGTLGLGKSSPFQRIRCTSIWKFERLGWIRNRLQHALLVEYAITPKGRAAAKDLLKKETTK